MSYSLIEFEWTTSISEKVVYLVNIAVNEIKPLFHVKAEKARVSLPVLILLNNWKGPKGVTQAKTCCAHCKSAVFNCTWILRTACMSRPCFLIYSLVVCLFLMPLNWLCYRKESHQLCWIRHWFYFNIKTRRIRFGRIKCSKHIFLVAESWQRPKPAKAGTKVF